MILAFTSCNKETLEFEVGYDYFPVKYGITRVYEVTDIFHDIDLSPAHDTQHYQIKEVISDYFLDAQKDSSYELIRYFRELDSLPWSAKDVWSIKKTATTGEVIEENKRIVRFAFPVNSRTKWNSNAFNNLNNNTSNYSAIHRPFSINGFNFDSTSTVEHINFLSFVDYKKEHYTYAKHLGRVYSVTKDLVIDNFDTLAIQKGSELVYRLIDYSY